MGRFACLVADALDVEGTSLRSSSSGSASGSGAAGLAASPPPPRYGLPPGLPAPIAASQAAAAAEGRVELGPLVGLLTSLFFPPAMRQNYAASYAGGGLLGAVVIDTMGEFVPPRRKPMPNGTIRCGQRLLAALLRFCALPGRGLLLSCSCWPSLVVFMPASVPWPSAHDACLHAACYAPLIMNTETQPAL